MWRGLCGDWCGRERRRRMRHKARVIGGRMNSAAAAEYLGITERTLKWMRDTRKVDYHKMGRECVYTVAELDRVWETSLVPAVKSGV